MTSPQFQRLVQGLKEKGKTCTVVESCCGGVINSSILAVPGSSAVYFGGSVVYNTKRSKKLMFNDDTLHKNLLQSYTQGENEADAYIRSKEFWTAQTAIAFCDQMDVDYAIAEGGASGPTFRPCGLDKGFSVIAIAGRNETTGKAQLLAQSTIRSTHAHRERNMRLFANAAAKLAADTIGIPNQPLTVEPKQDPHPQTPLQLDRATHLRGDPAALERMQQSQDAKFVVLRNSQECLISADSNLVLLSKHDLPPNVSEESFLGLETACQTPVFAVDVNETTGIQLPPNATFANTRTHAPLLKPYDYELVLYATALSNWKRTHKHCSICGHPLQLVQGGTCLQCTLPTCANLSWPRQDPSIIVLVINATGDKALLARSPRHPPRMHTALAGFVEAGETLEQALVREVYEETGAHVHEDFITYISSQPWPFPRSSMNGFLAQADHSRPLKIDPNELVSASWFDKGQVQEAALVPGAVMNAQVAEQALTANPYLQVLIPPKGVLARALIDEWLQMDEL